MTNSDKIEWYCYFCGEVLGDEFWLYSLNKSTDRVFLICNKKLCHEQADDKDVFMVKIKRSDNP